MIQSNIVKWSDIKNGTWIKDKYSGLGLVTTKFTNHLWISFEHYILKLDRSLIDHYPEDFEIVNDLPKVFGIPASLINQPHGFGS